MSLVLTICHIIRLYKCEHCTLKYSNKIILVWFLNFLFLGGRWFSKILRNICGWYVKILTIPYRGGWVVWKRPKTPLRNIKMAPNGREILKHFHFQFQYLSRSFNFHLKFVISLSTVSKCQILAGSPLGFISQSKFIYLYYTANPNPVQLTGKPCKSIPTGKYLLSLQGNPVLIAGSLFSLQSFPCISLYFPARDCSVVLCCPLLTKYNNFLPNAVSLEKLTQFLFANKVTSFLQ